MEHESPKFLGFLGGPKDQCCCGCTLKTGVYIIGFLDVLSAALSILSFSSLFATNGSVPNSQFLFQILGSISSIMQGLSGAIGMIGLSQLNLSYVQQYYFFKLWCLCFSFVYVIMSATWIPDTEYKTLGQMLTLATGAIGIAVGLMLIKVIWSAYIRLKNHENILVFQGAPAYLLANQPNYYARPDQVRPAMELTTR